MTGFNDVLSFFLNIVSLAARGAQEEFRVCALPLRRVSVHIAALVDGHRRHRLCCLSCFHRGALLWLVNGFWVVCADIFCLARYLSAQHRSGAVPIELRRRVGSHYHNRLGLLSVPRPGVWMGMDSPDHCTGLRDMWQSCSYHEHAAT
jgi:hypothetical protein